MVDYTKVLSREQATPKFGATFATGDHSSALVVAGDSTGNETTEFVYLTGQALATQYPALRVVYSLFDDATKEYGAPTVIQAGSGESYINFTGTYARFMPTEDLITLADTGSVLDVRVKVAATDWTPSASQRFLGKGAKSATNEISWLFGYAAAGTLTFVFSADGSATTTLQSSAATGFADGSTNWVRCVFNPSDVGATSATFYTSSDGITWTQLGTKQTSAGTTTLYSSSNQWYYLGGHYNINGFIGKIYDVEIRDGSGGAIANPKGLTVWTPSRRNTTDSVFNGGPTLHILNGSVSGMGYSYLTTNASKIFQKWQNQAILINSSHNEATAMGSALDTSVSGLKSAIVARCPFARIGGTIQNPETSNSQYMFEHNRRCEQLKRIYPKNSIEVVNFYDALKQSGQSIDTLVYPVDGVHMLAPGSAIAAVELTNWLNS